jgi:hypothetical protein
MMLRLTLSAILCAVAAAASAGRALRSEGFVKALEFKHRLRVCNAYPYSASLDVFRGKAEKLTGEAPMPYKACRDFMAPLKTGDKLEFKVGDASAGTFAVSDLPNNDAVLLLVIHRHDTLSTSVSFESHVFSNLANAQIVVLDTFKGKAKSHTSIMDAAALKKDQKDKARSEELRFDSVVAVNPGRYEVALTGDDGETKAKTDLVALDHESYVVLRIGVEAQQGPAYAQDLIVFPKSDASMLRNGASQVSASLVAAVLAAVALRW